METNPPAVVYPDNAAALGVCRGLGARGIPVLVFSSNRTGPGQYSRYARKMTCPPRARVGELVDLLVEFGRAQSQPPVLFLTDDASIVTIHRYREILEKWYRFPHPGWEVLRQILLKDQLYSSLEGVVPVPKSRAIGQEDELALAGREIGYPALVKPLLRCLADSPNPTHPSFDRFFGSKAVRVFTLKELTETYRTALSFGFSVLVQEEIEGPISSLYSLGIYATQKGTLAATFISQKLHQVPSDFGDGLVVKATWLPELIPLGERVVRRFGYYGIADIEFKWDARSKVYKLLDINPRPWFWIDLPTMCGVNLPYAAYLEALGRPIDPTDFAQRDFQAPWISLRGLLVYLAQSLSSRRSLAGLPTLLRHFWAHWLKALFSNQDFLFRMFLSPAYWWESLWVAGRKLKRLHGIRQGQ